MTKYDQNNSVVNPYQEAISIGIATKADEELINLSEDSSSKLQFSRNIVIQFWLSFQLKFTILSAETIKILLPYSYFHTCVKLDFRQCWASKTNIETSYNYQISCV